MMLTLRDPRGNHGGPTANDHPGSKPTYFKSGKHDHRGCKQNPYTCENNAMLHHSAPRRLVRFVPVHPARGEHDDGQGGEETGATSRSTGRNAPWKLGSAQGESITTWVCMPTGAISSPPLPLSFMSSENGVTSVEFMSPAGMRARSGRSKEAKCDPGPSVSGVSRNRGQARFFLKVFCDRTVCAVECGLPGRRRPTSEAGARDAPDGGS